jgi:hypothetical protein
LLDSGLKGSYEFEKMNAPVLSRFSDFARLDATGANLHALRAPLRTLHADGLQIWIKAARCAVIRVGNIITELRAFAADFASFSHDFKYLRIVESRSDNLLVHAQADLSKRFKTKTYNKRLS